MGKMSRAKRDLSTLKVAVQMFRLEEGRLPHKGEWPDFLTNGSPRHRDAYIEEDFLTDGKAMDPWGKAYIYTRISSRRFDIISHGADGAPGGRGDDADISLRKKGK